MTERVIFWPTAGRLDDALSLAAAKLTAAFSRTKGTAKSLPKEEFLELEKATGSTLIVALPLSDMLVATRKVRTASPLTARQIATNEIDQIDPLSEGVSTIIGGAFDRATRSLKIGLVKTDVFAALETKANKLGVTTLFLSTDGEATDQLAAPLTLKHQRTVRTLWTLSACALAAALWLASLALATTFEDQLAAARAVETELRQQVTARQNVDQAVSALEQLAQKGTDRLTPSARLQTLSELSDATPYGTRWLEISFDGLSITLTGIGPSAADVRSSLSEALPDHRTAFSEAIASEGNGLQSFAIEIEPSQ